MIGSLKDSTSSNFFIIDWSLTLSIQIMADISLGCYFLAWKCEWYFFQDIVISFDWTHDRKAEVGFFKKSNLSAFCRPLCLISYVGKWKTILIESILCIFSNIFCTSKSEMYVYFKFSNISKKIPREFNFSVKAPTSIQLQVQKTELLT